MISKITIAYFSPTGGVKNVANAIKLCCQELHHSVSLINLLTPVQRKMPYSFCKNDLLILCAPVYAGRLPRALFEIDNLKSDRACALGVLVYGNRACEDAPRDLTELLTSLNFKVKGYLTAVAEHSLHRSLARGRPDGDDCLAIKELMISFLVKLHAKSLADVVFDQSLPRKPLCAPMGIPAVEDIKKCAACRLCVKACPMGIIDKDTRLVDPKKQDLCMTCLSCVKRCPCGNRKIGAHAQALIDEKLTKVEELNFEPKPNELFINEIQGMACTI